MFRWTWAAGPAYEPPPPASNAAARSLAPAITRTTVAVPTAERACGVASWLRTSSEVRPALARSSEVPPSRAAYRSGNGVQPHAVPAGTESPKVTTRGTDRLDTDRLDAGRLGTST